MGDRDITDGPGYKPLPGTTWGCRVYRGGSARYHLAHHLLHRSSHLPIEHSSSKHLHVDKIMYEVFHVQPLVENLPLKIECIDVYGMPFEHGWPPPLLSDGCCETDSRIVVGTTDGSLLLYSIEEEPSFVINLIESKKILSKRPVDQLCVLKSAGAVFVLSGMSESAC